MSKSADAFRTISEVAEWLETPAHVLRFWESKFTQVKPVKRAGGRRYYRPADMRLLGGIKKLLHEDGMTIKGVQKILREQGIKHVSSLCTSSLAEEEDAGFMNAEETSSASDPIDTVVPFAKPELELDPETEDVPTAADETPAVSAAPPDDTSAQPLAEPPQATNQDMPEVKAYAEPSDSEAGADAAAVGDARDPAEQGPADESAPESEATATPEDVAPSDPEPVAEQTVDAAEPEAETEHPEVDVAAEAKDAPSDASTDDHPAKAAEPEALPEKEQASPEPVASDTLPLPGFVQHSAKDGRALDETVSDAVGPVPSGSHSDPSPGMLSRLSRINHLSPDTARQIAPLLDRLRALSR
jgi:DNA-binding transcriptional MerR regulator